LQLARDVLLARAGGMHMKKIQSKKLKLDRETLVTIQPHELDQANGGIIWTVVPIGVAVTLLFCRPGQAR
jgi:hypothetical protein